MTALGLGKYRFKLHETKCLKTFLCGFRSSVENTYFLPLDSSLPGMRINIFEMKINLNFNQRCSPYRPVNTLPLY